MSFSVLPLTPERMSDLDAVFQARGCSDAKKCYCMYYRLSNSEYRQQDSSTLSARNREAMLGLAQRELAPGLLGYLDGKPVGWVSLGPRSEFRRLKTSPTMRTADDLPVWSIICFVMHGEFRGQGIAHELLAAAIEFARANGATLLEAYPVDRSVAGAKSAPWFGSLTMFTTAGFQEVARNRPWRPIVRMALRPA